MHTSTIALSLLVLFLPQGEASVSSCLHCFSEGSNLDCESASDSVPRRECPEGKNAGCLVEVFQVYEDFVFTRDCCAEERCVTTHEEDDDTMWLDSVSCDTDDCNTMDPREPLP